MDIRMIALALFALIAIGLTVTWYNADDQPVFGPAKPGRITFKQVVFNFFDDVREGFLRLFSPLGGLVRRLWVWASPKLTNPTTWAAIVTNAALYAPLLLNDPVIAPLIQSLLAKYPLIGLAAAVLGLWATRSANAPMRIPAPSAHAGGGLVNNAAIA